MKIFLLLLLSIVGCGTALKNQIPQREVAAIPSIFAIQIVNGQAMVPGYLFSWGSSDRLQRLTKNGKSSDLPMGIIPKKSTAAGPDSDNQPLVTTEFPDLKGKQALFAWNHPTGAMALMITEDDDMPGEIYARSTNGRPPTLITMRPKPDARVMMIVSDGKGQKKINLKGVDLILHYKTDESSLHFREWIVLNPKAIESFTGDPRGLPAEIIEEMVNSTKSGAVLNEGESFILKYDRNEPFSAANVERAQSTAYRGEMVQKYLRGGDAIPEIFQRSLK